MSSQKVDLYNNYSYFIIESRDILKIQLTILICFIGILFFWKCNPECFPYFTVSNLISTLFEVFLYTVKVLLNFFLFLKKEEKKLLKQNFNIKCRQIVRRYEKSQQKCNCTVDTVSKLQKNSSCFPIAQILVADVLSLIAA